MGMCADGGITDACRLLQTRQVDTMLAGATDRCMEAPTYAKFSAIGALSHSLNSIRCKSKRFVMGEGAGVLLQEIVRCNR